MWYNFLHKTEYLHKLYNEIPSLNDVRIASITIWDEGNRIKIIFDMPRYADFPPTKWEGCNTAVVEVDFTSIAKLELNTISNTYRGDISINKNSEGLLEINIKGNLTLNAIADSGFIQHINAYQLLEERVI